MVLFFYIFATLLIAGALMVISVRNPVHAVLCLIFCFCNASGLMVLLGAEFLAMMLIIIYVGAVAVLFLFVVMMLDINNVIEKKPKTANIIVTCLLSLLVFVDLLIVILLASKVIIAKPSDYFIIDFEIGNVYAIGRMLYTDFILPFQTSGIILFVAMIGVIALTLRVRKGVKRQNVSTQLKRNKKNSLSFAKLDGKYGLNNLNYDN